MGDKMYVNILEHIFGELYNTLSRVLFVSAVEK